MLQDSTGSTDGVFDYSGATGRAAQRRAGDRPMSRAICCIAAAALFAGRISQAATPNDIVAQDLAHRSPEIHWPRDITPPAVASFSHNAILVQASCEKVWQVLVNAAAWPSWYPNSRNVRIADASGFLSRGASFDWDTFGVHIHSVVAEFEPPTRLAWFGDTHNARSYHTWLLQPTKRTCNVITEEATKGPPAPRNGARDLGALHRAHDLWLDRLKVRAESAGN